jgi:hypothetical protein
VSDDIRCLYSNCNKHNRINQDKNFIRPVIICGGDVRGSPSYRIYSRIEVYILKIRIKVKKCEVWCRVSSTGLKKIPYFVNIVMKL